jgi:hypothetical protein
MPASPERGWRAFFAAHSIRFDHNEEVSIESRHSYRFGFLKSEQWKSVRLEALVREGGRCQICGLESISNDAHHIWYPENIYETVPDQLAILCRPCHDFLHAVMPDCKTRNEEDGKAIFSKFSNAISVWRRAKNSIFEITGFESARELREAYSALKRENKHLKSGVSEPKVDGETVLRMIREWKSAYEEKLDSQANTVREVP